MRLLFSLVALLTGVALAFPSIRVTPRRTAQLCAPTRPSKLSNPLWIKVPGFGDEDGDDDDGEQMVILAGDESDEFPEEMMGDIEAGKPSEMMVMKQLLGINIFTYILAAAIVVFLSLNYALGPGWLGNAIGVQGTGTFDEVSDSLPSTIDLSDPSFRL